MIATSSEPPLRPRLVLLIGQSVSFGLLLALLIVPTSALFLESFGSARLPYTYIVIALVGLLTAPTLTALQRRWSVSRIAIGTSALLALLFVASWAGLVLADARWVSFALWVIFWLYIQIGFVFLGGQAGRLLDVRRLKRYFPRVVSGFAVGFLVGGAISVPLVVLLGRTENLFLVTAASALVLLGFQFATGRRFPVELAQAAPGAGRQPRPPLRRLLARRFVALIFGYQLLSAGASQILDFMLFDQAARRYSGSEALAQFVGNFTWIVNLVDILFLALVAGALLSRFGLRLGLAANPAGVAAFLIAMLVTGFVAGTAATPFFLLVGAARIGDIVLTDGTTRTSLNASYQALLPEERLAVQTNVEGVGVPVALGLTGVILLIFNAIPALTTLHLVGFALLVTLGWLTCAFLVYRDYGPNLLRVLKRSAVEEIDLTIADPATLAVVERLAGSPRLREVRLALDLLDAEDHPSLATHLVALSAHEDGDIAIEALGRIERRRPTGALPEVERVAMAHPDPEVRAAALRAIAALEGVEATPRLTATLDAPQAPLREAALVGLLRYGDGTGARAAMPRLLELARSDEVEARLAAARVIRETGAPGALDALRTLMRDHEPRVVEAAIRAADPARDASLLPHLLEALDRTATRPAALDVLATTRLDLTPAVEEALATGNRNRLGWLLRAHRQGRRAPLTPLLTRHLAHPDRRIRAALLAALATDGYRAAPDERGAITGAIRREARYALRHLRALEEIDELAALAPLRRALEDDERASIRQLFHYLSLLYDSRGMRRAADTLAGGRGAAAALALEMLEVTIAPELRDLVMPLVDPARDRGDRIAALDVHLEVEALAGRARLEQIATDPEGLWPSAWTRGCARFALARLDDRGGHAGEDEPLFGVIERVDVLGRTDLFGGTPARALAPVAEIIEEVAVDPGETLIDEGARDATMYIVVEGAVHAFRGGRTIIRLGPLDSVGELALLDPAPRAASVGALEPSRLYRIEREPFDAVMADRPEIARGVIRALVRRIRAQGQRATRTASGAVA